ncbi:MAG: hypothetical protein ACI8YQ_002341 [Polaribacter sp.]|jgi:hypothetical protein
MAKDALSFYDVKTKSKFEATEYEVREKNGRFYAVTKSVAEGATHECWRVLSKVDAERLK